MPWSTLSWSSRRWNAHVQLFRMAGDDERVVLANTYRPDNERGFSLQRSSGLQHPSRNMVSTCSANSGRRFPALKLPFRGETEPPSHDPEFCHQVSPRGPPARLPRRKDASTPCHGVLTQKGWPPQASVGQCGHPQYAGFGDYRGRLWRIKNLQTENLRFDRRIYFGRNPGSARGATILI